LSGIKAAFGSSQHGVRMIRPSAVVATGALALFAATALAQGAAPLAVRTTMTERVDPAMLGIWDVTNNAMDEDGLLDPAQLTDERWASIAAHADELAKAGRELAAADTIVAAAADDVEVGDGQVTMAHVQGKLAADTSGFRIHAGLFADHAEKIAAAARARDVAATGELVGEMDAVCESCHAVYWYGE
jgi:hypothetical protein